MLLKHRVKKLYYLFTPYSVTSIQATPGGPVNILFLTHVLNYWLIIYHNSCHGNSIMLSRMSAPPPTRDPGWDYGPSRWREGRRSFTAEASCRFGDVVDILPKTTKKHNEHVHLQGNASESLLKDQIRHNKGNNCGFQAVKMFIPTHNIFRTTCSCIFPLSVTDIIWGRELGGKCRWLGVVFRVCNYNHDAKLLGHLVCRKHFYILV